MTDVWLASVAAVIAFVSMIISFINVNRTQRKDSINDLDRFKRDLGLKAADEIIDSIIDLNRFVQEVANFKVRWDLYIKDKISDELLRQRIREIIEGLQQNSVKLLAQHRKREVIYSKFDDELKNIYELNTKLNLNFMLFGARHMDGKLTGKTDQEILATLSELKNEADDLLNRIDELLKGIQYEFLGKLFNDNKRK